MKAFMNMKYACHRNSRLTETKLPQATYWVQIILELLLSFKKINYFQCKVT